MDKDKQMERKSKKLKRKRKEKIRKRTVWQICVLFALFVHFFFIPSL